MVSMRKASVLAKMCSERSPAGRARNASRRGASARPSIRYRTCAIQLVQATLDTDAAGEALVDLDRKVLRWDARNTTLDPLARIRERKRKRIAIAHKAGYLPIVGYLHQRLDVTRFPRPQHTDPTVDHRTLVTSRTFA